MSVRRNNSRTMPPPQPPQSQSQSTYNPQFGQQQQQQQQPQYNQQSIVTPQKAIEMIIPRLLALEQKQASTMNSDVGMQDQSELQSAVADCTQNINILAAENAELKDMLLKLQTYTMSVNKMLMDERERNGNNSNNSNTSENKL